ncbi:dTDP-4-dehydrorhamnose 3,5-epimerase [Haematobacter missouriensis]|uniref:dTDP-4-dehydrorhamnose 3,5-epimerase n=1 Tax=Haematobacter missouriensis TaxID=366616 RepID=A0A212AV76_9RHOB|nr:dTDP-4-dehydrorhamnose 3,5-epimerase [Haematobacter missouriensis]KFI28474.1 dTDP-4-dehydrorhamnose 3,5-epimerase [Haematobacter missouriensis]OWJ74917.1 dTDP-4-dehydrorhamnose 3,5-epimerase [Haematobacter missouriensis]OWJ85316.1 dTDP-4-dehydrorhamnose 3,5-epimerase [Haematobacter missouriensis]
MQIEETTLPGVVIITPKRFGDDRGYFSETYNLKALSDLGISTPFVQDNQSLSRQVGTVRGLHFQRPPHAQAKLVRVLQGRILDVAVDVRKGSPHYGKWVGVELSAEDGRQLLIPAGFLHGFVTREPDTLVFYKCSDYYAPECDGAVRFDDSDIGIDWGISPDDAVLSAKDAAAPAFADFDSPFPYTE